MNNSEISEIFAISRRTAGADVWDSIFRALDENINASALPDALTVLTDELCLPVFLPALAALEWVVYQAGTSKTPIAASEDEFELNPTLELVESDWKLSHLFDSSNENRPVEQGRQITVIWRDPLSEKVKLKAASDEDLLALKLVAEGIGLEGAIEEGATFEMVAKSLRQAVKQGMLIGPHSMLRRDIGIYAKEIPKQPDLVYADTFTLQWHITHECDLHCKHCYDRSERSHLTLEQGESILDDLKRFCRQRYVNGHVCLSGGNPLLYPQFFDLYAAAAKRGLSTSILGNPAAKEPLEKIIDIRKPEYFQVSLEGLEDQNDFIRGRGFFEKVLRFLDLLRKMDIESAVMLTLTKDNIDQVLPLAERLKGRADYFTFNRLCPVGEGANLLLPSKEAYARFVENYVAAARDNSILGYKDNLINIVLERRGKTLFDGCTGFGCGAAFNFIAILPDGEAHACRKFPSPIGNVITQSIAEVYDSPAAASYRRGTMACDGCRMRPVCGGCLAVLYGLGKNITVDMDPYCSIDQ